MAVLGTEDPTRREGGVLFFYLDLLPRWYVWLVMDAGCALFGHDTFLCWNGRNWRSRLWGWSLQARLPFESPTPATAGGAHRVWEIPVAISHEVRKHVWPR